MTIVISITAALLVLFGIGLIRRYNRNQRGEFIDTFQFHPAVINKFREVRPDLTEAQEALVFAALREYFHLCNQAGRRMVSMPSQVVDDAWHAFILFTRGYQRFCHKAFGRFLHHTPAEAMASPHLATDGLKRAWRLACAHDGIDPKTPPNLPLLFGIDSQLQIDNGFYYVPDCSSVKRTDRNGVYCASDIGCSSGCAGDSGVDSGSSEGDGDSGCGGGCGGD